MEYVRRFTHSKLFSHVGWLLFTFSLLWLSGDFAYSTVTHYRLQQWESAVARDADGVRLGCKEFTVGQGEVALLMVHGFGDSPALYHKMAPALAERGYTCRAMRLPGFAEPMDTYASADRGQWLKAVADEIDQLKQNHDTVWIVAHSMGATIAIDHLLQYPTSVDGVVFMAPLIDVSDARSPVLSASAWFDICKGTLAFTDVIESIFADELSTHNAAGYARDRFIPRSIYEGMFASMQAIQGNGQSVRAPLLMFLSSEDPVVDSAAAEGFFQQVASQQKQLVYADRAGHNIPAALGSGEVVDEIDRFITTQQRSI